MLSAFVVPHALEPGSSTTIRVFKASVVEGGSLSRMEARIYALADSQFVDTVILEDGWTAVTADRRLSAQYEHSLAVTEDGVTVLTVQNDEGRWEPPGRYHPPGWQPDPP